MTTVSPLPDESALGPQAAQLQALHAAAAQLSEGQYQLTLAYADPGRMLGDGWQEIHEHSIVAREGIDAAAASLAYELADASGRGDAAYAAACACYDTAARGWSGPAGIVADDCPDAVVVASESASHAAWGLSVRDLLTGRSKWEQAAYDALTWPWRLAVGQIHPADPIEPVGGVW
jgi:hypothetical protein